MTATELAAALANQCERTCQHLLPGGRLDSGNWVIGSITGDRGKSLRIQITGDRKGQWLDFATGEKGDMIGLWKAVTGLSLGDTCKEAAAFLGLEIEEDRPATVSHTWATTQREMGTGTEHDIAALCLQRRLPTDAGIRTAIEHGVLFFGPVYDKLPDSQQGQSHASWILTDSARLGAQARRMDGVPWGNGAKAKTIHGTTSKWPVGIANAGTLDIALVEGGPDLLAAYTALALLGLTDKIQPASMLGSSQSIHRDALAAFAKKTVWLFPHNDGNLAGLSGAARWTAQLKDSTIYPFDFSAYPGVKDLNDFVSALATPQAAEDDFEPALMGEEV